MKCLMCGADCQYALNFYTCLPHFKLYDNLMVLITSTSRIRINKAQKLVKIKSLDDWILSENIFEFPLEIEFAAIDKEYVSHLLQRVEKLVNFQ